MFNGSALPTFVSFNPVYNNFTVYSDLNSSAGTYSITLEISDGTQTYTSNFILTVTQFDFCTINTVTPQMIPSQTYQVHSSALVYQHPAFAIDYPYCVSSFDYEARLANGTRFPIAFATYDNATRTFTV